MQPDQIAESVRHYDVTVRLQVTAKTAEQAVSMVRYDLQRHLYTWPVHVLEAVLIDGQAGDSGVNSSQCHRDIDQLLAEIKRLRDMLTLCENHCSDGFVAEQARTVLAHRIELIDGTGCAPAENRGSTDVH